MSFLAFPYYTSDSLRFSFIIYKLFWHESIPAIPYGPARAPAGNVSRRLFNSLFSVYVAQPYSKKSTRVTKIVSVRLNIFFKYIHKYPYGNWKIYCVQPCTVYNMVICTFPFSFHNLFSNRNGFTSNAVKNEAFKMPQGDLISCSKPFCSLVVCLKHSEANTVSFLYDAVIKSWQTPESSTILFEALRHYSSRLWDLTRVFCMFDLEC